MMIRKKDLLNTTLNLLLQLEIADSWGPLSLPESLMAKATFLSS